MCLAIPGKVVKITDDSNYAIVDYGGVENKANTELVDVNVGDWVIVHAGFAIEKMSEGDADEVLKLLK